VAARAIVPNRGWENGDRGKHLGWERGQHRGWEKANGGEHPRQVRDVNRDRRDVTRDQKAERRGAKATTRVSASKDRQAVGAKAAIR